MSEVIIADTPEKIAKEFITASAIRKTVDEWLNEVDYDELNNGSYMPSLFALKFTNFIQLVNGVGGTENKTPVVHLAMLDKIAGKKEKIVNLCARGMAKTTLMAEYLTLYLALFGEIDGFGKVDGMLFVGNSMEAGVKDFRKNVEFRWETSEYLQEWLPKENVKITDGAMEFKSKKGNRFGVKMYGAKSGIRGSKIDGKRPNLAVLDDLISDEDAKSSAAKATIRDTIHKAINNALHPTKRKTIFNGTPFAKDDPMYEAVESGAWDVNVWPVCERFPCSKEEFRGAWDDRFTYEFVKKQYEEAVLEGTVGGFMQELMLRITSAEERLVAEEDIRWYKRQSLLDNKHNFNFYITTDWATKVGQMHDYSVISVWAYNNNGDWFWVDGCREKLLMDKMLQKLFDYVSIYQPESVGVETSGQQAGFIPWIQEKMFEKNVYFNFATTKGVMGINPGNSDKISRFNRILPHFKAGKIFFPVEMKTSIIIGAFMEELSLITLSGIKSRKDDCIDTISQLAYLKPYKPSEQTPVSVTNDGVFSLGRDTSEDVNSLSSYIV